MARIDTLYRNIRTVETTPEGDERTSISASESRAIGSAITRDSFGPRERRVAIAVELLHTPDAFATTAAYQAFVASARTLGINAPAMPTASSVTFVELDDASSDYSIRLNGFEIGRSNTGGGEPIVHVAGNGRFVLWNTRGTVGGFENAGQAIMCYDATTRVTTRLADTYDEFNEITSARLPSGALMFFAVAAVDGEGSTTRILDPEQGWIASADGAFRRVRGNSLVLEAENSEGDSFTNTYPISRLNDAEPIHEEPDEFGAAYVSYEQMLATFNAAQGGTSVVPGDAPAPVDAAFAALASRLDNAELRKFVVQNNNVDGDGNPFPPTTFFSVTGGVNDVMQTYILDENGIVLHHGDGAE